MSVHKGPRFDSPFMHTAYIEGQTHYLQNRPLDPLRFQDSFRQSLYEEGWVRESSDHMEAVSHRGVAR